MELWHSFAWPSISLFCLLPFASPLLPLKLGKAPEGSLPRLPATRIDLKEIIIMLPEVSSWA